MYNIYNASEVFYIWDIENQTMSLIGDENDLIHHLARCYRVSWWCGSELINSIFESYACNINEEGKKYQIFDGMDRCINPRIYEREARKLYLEVYKKKQQKQEYRRWIRKYCGEFRREPVEGIHKWRGGPSCRGRKVTHLKKMYANPEYKEFNRGSRDEVPDWWDDCKFRCRQRSWKSHRKHQWKEK